MDLNVHYSNRFKLVHSLRQTDNARALGNVILFAYLRVGRLNAVCTYKVYRLM